MIFDFFRYLYTKSLALNLTLFLTYSIQCSQTVLGNERHFVNYIENLTRKKALKL